MKSPFFIWLLTVHLLLKICIVNTKTFKARCVVIVHPEEIDEYDGSLDEDEAMYVNELKDEPPEPPPFPSIRYNQSLDSAS